MLSNTEIPDKLRHLVQVRPAAAGKPGYRVCFPVTETNNPEIQTFITGLLRTTGQPVIPEPVSPESSATCRMMQGMPSTMAAQTTATQRCRPAC